MNSVNKTLYIPLYGKAYVSRKGILLQDPKAEEIWDTEGFALKGKAASKWLAYYMGMRSAVFDQWLNRQRSAHPDAVILHLGCGMDSRISRLGYPGQLWYDVDFPGVIRERNRYFRESESYRMCPADLRTPDWTLNLPQRKSAIILMEGVSMYLTLPELKNLTESLSRHFEEIHLLMDCYSERAARLSRYKNPINEVGVTKVCGLDDPTLLPIPFLTEWEMTPATLINQLPHGERGIFRLLFAGRFARSLYRLYEYGS